MLLRDVRLKYLGTTLAESLDLGHISGRVERPDIFAHLLHMAGDEDSPGEETQPPSGLQTPQSLQVTATTQQKLPQGHCLLCKVLEGSGKLQELQPLYLTALGLQWSISKSIQPSLRTAGAHSYTLMLRSKVQMTPK